MKICVLGLGYVGLPLYFLARNKGYDVMGFDISESKVKELKSKVTDITEKIVNEGFMKYDSFEFTSDPRELSKAEVFFVAVPTPVGDDKVPNYKYIIRANKMIINNSQKGILIIQESTINPGTCEGIVKPLFDNSGLDL